MNNPELIRLGWELVQLMQRFEKVLMAEIDVQDTPETRPDAPQAPTSTEAGVDNGEKPLYVKTGGFSS